MGSIKVNYVFGQLIYAIARANHSLSENDRTKLHDLFVAEMKKGTPDLDFSDVITHILKKEKKDLETTYNWAIQSLKLPHNEVDEITKSKFLRLVALVIKSFPSELINGEKLIDRLNADLPTS